MTLVFNRGKLGGGGFVTDIDISPDGLTRLIRTDVYGANIFNSTTSLWEQVVTGTSMPVAERILGNNGAGFGCYSIRVAPSNSNIVYAVFPAITGLDSTVYKSTDRCVSWTATNLTPMNMTVQSDPGRLYGQKMAVHPTNPDIVIVGNSAGEIYRTANGGTSWALITTPTGDDPVIVFDATDGTKVYISWRSGTSRIYRSTDSGATFSQLTGGPDTVRRMASAADGIIYIIDDDGDTTNAWKLSGTTFTNFAEAAASTSGWHSVACDPTDATKVTLGFVAGNISTSTDRGATWGGIYPTAGINVANDVAWLGWTLDDYKTNGNMVYDPIDAGLLWFAEGIGVWTTTPPLDDSQPTWTSVTAGNDELIIDDVIFPPGGKAILSTQDRGTFRIADPTVYPSTHGPGRTVSLHHAWGIDYATSDPLFIAVPNQAGPGHYYSDDGGVTWTAFASQPTGVAGNMAALSPTSIVYCPSNNGVPRYTTNGGTSWALCTFPGDVPTVEGDELNPTGFGFSLYNNLKFLAADKVSSVYYAYNYITGDTYKSVDGGANFTKTADAVTIAGGIGTSQRLQTVPGQAGHLFLTSGTREPTTPGLHPISMAMKRSTDGGANWSEVSDVAESWALGFGKEAPGQSYPTIMVAGYANGDTLPGIYTSTDNCVTWVLQTRAPDNSLDLPRAIAGDMNNYGTFYIGMSGSGFVYSEVVPSTEAGRVRIRLR